MLIDILLILLLGPIGVVIVLFRHFGNKSGDKSAAQLSLSREDSVSQCFFLIAFFFLGVTLLAFNKDFGDPLSWRTIILITSLCGLLGAYYLKTIYILIFSLIGLVSWWVAEATFWISSKDIQTIAILVGVSLIALLMYAVGRIHEQKPRYTRFALVYTVLSIVSVTTILFYFSTKSGIATIGSLTHGTQFFASWQLSLSLLSLLAAFMGAALYATWKKLMRPLESAAIFVLAGLFLVLAMMPEQSMFVGSGTRFYAGSSILSPTGALWAIVLNVALFAELIGLIFLGYVRRETWLINTGAVLMFLLILVKYSDWFFSFLNKSIFFIGAGVLLFVVGWLMERGRRYMIKSISAQSPEAPK